MSLSEVSNILWRERQLLELLVFKLEEEQLVLASGRTRWLSHATREVETILEEIKRVELERAMAVAGSARSPSRIATCSSAGSKLRARRSLHSARSTSTRTTRAAPCLIARWPCAW